MDMITLLLADLFLTAIRKDRVNQDEPKPGLLLVTCTDQLSGKMHSKIMTDDELIAVVSCAISNDGEGMGEQYTLANAACEGFPTECRPIP